MIDYPRNGKWRIAYTLAPNDSELVVSYDQELTVQDIVTVEAFDTEAEAKARVSELGFVWPDT